MNGKKIKRIITLAVSIFILASLMAGCGSKSNSSTQTPVSTAEKPLEPLKISMMMQYYATDFIDKSNVVVKEIEKRTNTVLDFTLVPSGNYIEKLNMTIASGTLPDLITIDTPSNSTFVSRALNGGFWEIGKYYKDYKNMTEYPVNSWENLKLSDGKIYLIPKPRPIVGQATMVSFREDWLKKLNLQTPKNHDEIYKVLKAFVENDPDGNGKKDTVGLVGSPSQDGTGLGEMTGLFASFISAPTSNYNIMLAKDGTIKWTLDEKEFKDALAWFKKLYSEGLLNKDFVSMKRQQMRDAAMAGKTGAVTESTAANWVITEGLKKVVPEGNFTTLPYMTNASGFKYYPASSGFAGGYAIPKNSVDETKFKRIMKFIDDMSTEEAWELANYGFKDTHFNKKSDLVYEATAQAATDKIGATLTGIFQNRYIKYQYAVAAARVPANEIEINKKQIDEQLKIAYSSPMEGLQVDSWIKIQNDTNKKINDKVLKIIIGTETLESWDDFAKKMLADDNLKKAMADINTAYKAKSGK